MIKSVHNYNKNYNKIKNFNINNYKKIKTNLTN